MRDFAAVAATAGPPRRSRGPDGRLRGSARGGPVLRSAPALAPALLVLPEVGRGDGVLGARPVALRVCEAVDLEVAGARPASARAGSVYDEGVQRREVAFSSTV